MSSLPPVTPGRQHPAAAARTDGQNMVRPEMTLARLEELVALEDESAFFQGAVDYSAQLTGSRRAFFYVVEGDSLLPKFVSESPEGVFPAQQQIDLIATTAVRQGGSQRATVSLKQGRFTLLCVPFMAPGRTPMALALLLGPERAQFVEPAFTVLHLVTQIFVRQAMNAHAQRLQDGFDQSTLLIDLYTRAAAAADFKEAVALICDELGQLFGCARLAIGTGNQFRCKVQGISGAGSLQQASQGTTLLSSPMRESIGVDATIQWPENRETPGLLISAGHQELLETLHVTALTASPLKTDEPEPRTAGAWVFLWDQEHPLENRNLELIEAASPHLAGLLLMLRQTYPSGVRGAIRRFRVRASKAKKAAAIIIPLIALGVLLFPIPHRISADCQLQPEQVRQVAAPFEATLERAVVKPGDEVEEGDLLAILDGREIRWRLAEAIARREAALKRRDEALAAKEASATQMAQFEADSLRLQTELLQFQQDNLEVRAPIAGVVLSGNLERSQGVPVSSGQKLFDIAPHGGMQLEIAVPDSEISRVELGMPVRFRLESRAGYAYETEVSDIHPISEVQDSNNVFVCLAEVPDPDEELRPGMLGKARIISHHRPVGWILFYRLGEYLRLHVW